MRKSQHMSCVFRLQLNDSSSQQSSVGTCVAQCTLHNNNVVAVKVIYLTYKMLRKSNFGIRTIQMAHKMKYMRG